ncbi:MAG TPA: [FeFe] hydrogenase, group A [Tepidisphaeraceae bacterium]|nr:[FeFe] hydrogenase, group A [Tepidisphaeraceae bacterium]
MNNDKTLTIDGLTVAIDGERNLLELIRKADIDLPTFCYHSELSVYGACRLCLVDVEGRGIQAACSTPPETGLKVRTTTDEIREIRKIAIELLLANHDQSCPTCAKSASCQLQEVARRLGVQYVRFKPVHQSVQIDDSSPSLVRDPNKCVLCGDCVRFCAEVQGIGAIDFAHRGHQTQVVPAFGRLLGEVECVNCGQCAAVCPTGALAPKSEVDQVWKAIHDPKKIVIVQVAPAVRVALGECFGDLPGTVTTGQIVAALRRIGFDIVYDTSFSADLTVVEEANEFIRRKMNGERLPQFTSCCPGWVKFAEQYFPELLPNLSTCRSPQQMLGSLVKQILPAQKKVQGSDIVVVSIMPCTAKKFEAKRPEFYRDGVADVDHVITTQELARMIQEAGIRFRNLNPESFDMPMGFKTGAGVIFGNSGGVSEAVLRYAIEAVTGQKLQNPDFHQVRGENGLRTTTLKVGEAELKMAIVFGLKNARELAEKVRRGECEFDIIEVMACPGGCIGGAGQPISRAADVRRLRTRGLYDADKMLDLHKSQENHFVTQCYEQVLGEVNGHRAHELLHTEYVSRRRILGDLTMDGVPTNGKKQAAKLKVGVCVGTNCFLKGGQKILQSLLEHVQEEGCQHDVEIAATFCFENCGGGPTVTIGNRRINECDVTKAIGALKDELQVHTNKEVREN